MGKPVGMPVGMQTMRGYTLESCMVCESEFATDDGSVVCRACKMTLSGGDREPWWLRLLRWVVR